LLLAMIPKVPNAETIKPAVRKTNAARQSIREW